MDTPGTSRQLPKAATLVDLGEKEYNPALCVICQDPKDSTPLTSGDKGRESVKRAAELREDNVYKRIKTYHSGTNESHIFKYHNTTRCFKKYVHASYLKSAVQTKSDQEKDKLDQESLSSPPRILSRKTLSLFST